jgi:hypothetical protein
MRQKFVKDDDGHWYLINAEDEEEFRRWVEHIEKEMSVADCPRWTGRGFDLYCIAGGPNRWTFEKPILDA